MKRLFVSLACAALSSACGSQETTVQRDSIQALDAQTPVLGSDASLPAAEQDAQGTSSESDAGLAPLSVRCTPAASSRVVASELEAAGTYAFATLDLALEDSTRPTPKNGNFNGAQSRSLQTKVWYPAGPAGLFPATRPLAQGGPFPLVIYAHGFNLNSDAGQYLGEHLASHGFIVAAPNFPLSQQNAQGGATFDDLAQQPGDLSFVIDQVLASAGNAAVLAGGIERAQIVVVGYSLGGTTAMLIAHHPALRDPRVRAIVSLAGIHAPFGPSFYAGTPLPTLVMHGESDAIVPYEQNARSSLTRGAPNIHLASISKGTHVGFATLPLEPALGVLGPVVAPQGSDPNNVDGIGCGAVGNLVPRDTMWMKQLGGAENGIVEAAPLDPCKLNQLGKPALSAPEQRTFAKQAVLAFLRAYLAQDADVRADHCAFLGTLGGQSGVSME